MPQLQPELATGNALADAYRATRALTEALIAPLSDADATLQSMDDASPAKWHVAHTNWFFETFLLRDNRSDYALYDADWPYLFNSYYEAEGDRIARGRRGMVSRPDVEQLLAWRAHVDAAMAPVLEGGAHGELIALGLAHEQQHQELLLTDIKHALFQNPLGPAMWDASAPTAEAGEQGWDTHPGGIARIGHDGSGFAFDCEGPAHRALIEPFALAKRLVTNGEWDAFIADGSYRDPALWLSDGWGWLQANGIAAPLYWRRGRTVHPRRLAAARPGRAGDAYQLLRGGRFRELGGGAAADRVRVGGYRAGAIGRRARA